MAQKLWEKSVQVNEEIDRFTVGKDRELDLYLAKHDVLGSMAHITMLESIGLLSADELQVLLAELKNIYASAERGEFVIEDGIEDVHSQVELMLTRKLGDVGKKIHSGRSRNDQVLVDLKLFTREQLKQIAEAVEDLFQWGGLFKFPVRPLQDGFIGIIQPVTLTFGYGIQSLRIELAVVDGDIRINRCSHFDTDKTAASRRIGQNILAVGCTGKRSDSRQFGEALLI